MEQLGADFKSEPVKVTLDIKNILGIPIIVVFDICHVLKLLRNCLGDFKTLKNGKNKTIDWKYFCELNEIQTKIGLHLANKLRLKHIQYKSNKMKTKLACQTFSRSVAKSFEYLQNILKNSDFENCDATIEFTYVVNDLFDWLNSKNKFGKRNKAPLSKENYLEWTTKFEFFTEYIKNLKHVDGQSVLKGPRKAGFMGFIIAMKSFRFMYDLYVRTNQLQYLLTFKFSQDPLCIKSIEFYLVTF